MELQPAERALVGADGWCWHFGWTLIYWFDRDQKDLVACCFWRRSIIVAIILGGLIRKIAASSTHLRNET
jgi:hypothetical protein